MRRPESRTTEIWRGEEINRIPTTFGYTVVQYFDGLTVNVYKEYEDGREEFDGPATLDASHEYYKSKT